MGFLTSFGKVEVNEAADQLVAFLVSCNPVGATKAQKEQIHNRLSELTVFRAEAKQKWTEKQTALDADKKRYNDKVELAQAWKTEADLPATTADRKAELQGKMSQKVQELQALSQKIDTETKAANLAKQTFDRYDHAVVTTNQKLQATIAQADELTSNLELAKLEREGAQESVNAARVLSGLDTANDSFDVATNAIKKQTDKLRAQAAGMEQEASLLTAEKKSDVSDEEELARIRGAKSTQSVDDQLAELAGKFK